MPVPLTLLTITPVSAGPRLTPYSARGLTQTLNPIEGAGRLGVQLRRDIRANLMDLTYEPFRKYKSTISCNDATAPAFDGAWAGQIVIVECTEELAYLTHGGTPQRNEVSGSSREEGDFTYYRPVLTMMVISVHNDFAEWRSDNQWAIELEEV